MSKLIVGATALNLTLVVLNLAANRPVEARTEPVLRAKRLEIVDDQGRVRASIGIEAPTTVDGRTYPETVLLRLSDPKTGPGVKLSTGVDGSAIGLYDEADAGVSLFAKGDRNRVEVRARDGRVKVIEP